MAVLLRQIKNPPLLQSMKKTELQAHKSFVMYLFINIYAAFFFKVLLIKLQIYNS